MPTAPAGPPPVPVAPAGPPPVPVAHPSAAAPVAPSTLPLPQQPYFVANVVVLGLSVLLFVAFLLKDVATAELLDWGFFASAAGFVLAIGLFVASLVLRSKTKKAGGRQIIAVLAVVLSSVNLVLIVATIVVFVALIGMFFWMLGGLF